VAARPDRSSGERDTLERLHEDEAALEQEVAWARSRAAAAIEAARREAEALVGEARREAERARAAMRARAAAEADAARATAEEETRAAVAALASGAARNRERAVARALDVVLGRAP